MPSFASIIMSLQIRFVNKQSCCFFFCFSALADQSSGKKGALGRTFVFVCLLLLLLSFVVILVFLFVCLFVFFILGHVQEESLIYKPRSRSSLFALISEVFVDCNCTHNFFYFILFFFTVPFRDSVLTKLLKNALGGNSKTIMVSPGSSCKKESKDCGQQ